MAGNEMGPDQAGKFGRTPLEVLTDIEENLHTFIRFKEAYRKLGKEQQGSTYSEESQVVLPVALKMFFDMAFSRAQDGYEKHGQMLVSHDGRDTLADAMQEFIDGFKYLVKAYMERGEAELEIRPESQELKKVQEELKETQEDRDRWRTHLEDCILKQAKQIDVLRQANEDQGKRLEAAEAKVTALRKTNADLARELVNASDSQEEWKKAYYKETDRRRQLEGKVGELQETYQTVLDSTRRVLDLIHRD